VRDAALTAYVLIWPILTAITLIVMLVGVYRDSRRAKRDGDSMV
jgi:hypothetical protein